MQDFWLYFNLGREHIADLAGYDHILFVTALCLRYVIRDWRKILILVTAFTIGHSITLALSALKYLNISTEWIEFLIPITIFITALTNVLQKDTNPKKRGSFVYGLALFFGLIHGLGFSNYLKSLLGKDNSIVSELLAFNIGLEVGQLVIVAAVLLLSVICIQLLKIQRRDYILFTSGAVFGIALLMTFERFPN
jgi:cytochrome bd-type quinol oxidase subunit 2